jgi:NTP pyrophosphatase (non-canonical NTP hydrolase)
LQFTALALCGECGELANALKKMVRSQALGMSLDRHKNHARSELADIYAYLLKLSSLLSVDLEAEYLETLGLNCLRFPIVNRHTLPRVIGIGGPEASKIANRIRGVTSSVTTARFEMLMLPAPPMKSSRKYVDWLRSAKAKIAMRLSAGQCKYLLLVNDPALSTVSFRSLRLCGNMKHDMAILRSWISIEELICIKGSGRGLLLTHDAAPPSAIERLVNHGAKVIHSSADWAAILKATRSLESKTD